MDHKIVTWCAQRRRISLVLLTLCGLYLAQKPMGAALTSDHVTGPLFALLYGPPPPAPKSTGSYETIGLVDGQVINHLPLRFLSLSVDSSQAIGGSFWSKSGQKEMVPGGSPTPAFDFGRPRLRALTRHLAPGYLRIGGTEADHIFYDMREDPVRRPPAPYKRLLTRKRWDAINDFAAQTGLSLIFTVNAGPGPRDAEGAFDTDNVSSLLAYAAARSHRVDVWELGNEVNVFWLVHGLSNQVSGAQYGDDLRRLKRTVRSFFPTARVAGPAEFFWPGMGQPASFQFDVLGDFLRANGKDADIITWHYYPQQSRRCIVATRRAEPAKLINPAHLDEFNRWADHVNALRDAHAPQAEVWLGESGPAQCGGEPGMSNRYVSSLWWLDELGLAAVQGHKVVVRQTLAGADYGLVDEKTLEPFPDYWASMMWKRFMGPDVMKVRRTGRNPYLRLYAHCGTQGAQRGLTYLAINLDPSLPAEIRFDGSSDTGFQATADAHVFEISADGLLSQKVRLGGAPLKFESNMTARLSSGRSSLTEGRMTLAPLTYAFARFPRAPACLRAAVMGPSN